MIKEYIIKQTLGKGSYGIVYKVQKKNTNEIYVIKQIALRGLSQKEIDEVRQEAKILSSINSDFVVKYYDSFEENDNINIVMEYCDEGDLNDFIIKKKESQTLIEEDLIWNLFIKITIGLAHIHQMKILHRDLKTMNIFLKNGFQVKIGDLGVAKILLKNSFAKTLIGTPYYLSPEICQEKPYNDKSDVWALGCILYELCTFKHPFDAKSQGALILKIMNNTPENINNTYSKDLCNLIHLLLEKESEKRPSCKDILNLDFIINKIKKLGLFNYIKNFIQEKNLLINVNNNSKNINSNQNNSRYNLKNELCKKEIINSNKYKNINNNIQFSGIKINEIVLGNNTKSNINKQPISNRNLNNHALINNFFINDEKNKYNKKLSNVIISKKNSKINLERNHDIISKKIGKINPCKLELNIPHNPPITFKNFFHGKILTNRNNEKRFNLNQEKGKMIINNHINIKKIVPNDKFEEKNIKIKQEKNERNDIIGNNRIINKKGSNLSDKIKLNKDNNFIIKYNKLVYDGNNKNKYFKNIKEKSINKDFINILQKKDKNTSKNITKNENMKNQVFEKKDSTNFEIINNISYNSLDCENIIDNDENNSLEDSIEEIYINNTKNKQNLINDDIENKNDKGKLKINEHEDENVKEIKEINNMYIQKINNNDNEISKNRANLNKEIASLREKNKEIKKDIFNIIGEDDYKFIMNLFENNNVNEPNKNEEICEEIEKFSKNNYSSEKKEKFIYYYLLLVSNDCLLSKKIKEFQNLNS